MHYPEWSSILANGSRVVDPEEGSRPAVGRAVEGIDREVVAIGTDRADIVAVGTGLAGTGHLAAAVGTELVVLDTAVAGAGNLSLEAGTRQGTEDKLAIHSGTEMEDTAQDWPARHTAEVDTDLAGVGTVRLVAGAGTDLAVAEGTDRVPPVEHIRAFRGIDGTVLPQ